MTLSEQIEAPVCDMVNCNSRAPVNHPFCAKHRIDCHSTHCERRGECASPSECGDRNALLRGFDSIMGAPDYKPDERREKLLTWAWANFAEIRTALRAKENEHGR